MLASRFVVRGGFFGGKTHQILLVLQAGLVVDLLLGLAVLGRVLAGVLAVLFPERHLELAEANHFGI